MFRGLQGLIWMLPRHHHIARVVAAVVMAVVVDVAAAGIQEFKSPRFLSCRIPECLNS